MSAPTLTHHLATMACNNAWANHRLLGACSALSQQDFVATRVSFFPSIKTTLNHNLTVDWYYVDALERSLHGEPPNPDTEQFFCVDDAPLRAADFAHLGYSEQAIWDR